MPGADGQIADCGRGILVGNLEVCPRYPIGERFDRVLHVWHPKQPPTCPHAMANPDDPACVLYLENTPLTPEVLGKVRAAAEAPGRLLIHCSAGLGRSATLCVYALAIRGADHFDAMADVARAMWGQYQIPHAPAFDCKRLNEILAALGR